MTDEPDRTVNDGFTDEGDIDGLIAALEQEVVGAQENAAVQVEVSSGSVSKAQETTRKFVIITLLAVYVLALLTYSGWVIIAPPTIDGYICADQAAQNANLCVGRWTQTTEALKDVVVTWILPVLTLTIGYYFGKNMDGDA